MERLPEGTTTSRLVIRRWRLVDAPALAAAVGASLDHLHPWMPWAGLQAPTVEAEVELINGWQATWAAGGDTVFGVLARTDDDSTGGAVLGGTGLHRRLGPDALEIGYWIHVDHVRRGYATELSRALTDLAFTIDGIDVVEIHHDAANVPSGRVPWRLGYRRLADIQHPPEAAAETGVRWVWRMRREDWPPQDDVS